MLMNVYCTENFWYVYNIHTYYNHNISGMLYIHTKMHEEALHYFFLSTFLTRSPLLSALLFP